MRKEQDNIFCNGKVRKNVAWHRVAEKFNEKSQVKVTGEQCCNKWKKLEEKFKKVQEHNEKTGSDRKDMEFQEELAEFFGSDPKIIPLSTVSTITASQCEGDSSSDEDGSARNEPPKKKRKRKSKSSASEMIEFLREFKEDKEKEAKEKIAVVTKMHKEKMDVMDRFLSILSKK